MLEIALNIENRRRWIFRRRRLQRSLPSTWAQVPEGRRLQWWRWTLEGRRGAVLAAAMDVKESLLKKIQPDDLAVLLMGLEWMQPAANCKDYPIGQFRHGRRTYYLPAPQGQNIACLEFGLADEYYHAYLDDPTPRNLTLLTACICRTANPDQEDARRRDDKRRRLHSRGEVQANADRLQNAPLEIHAAALWYFAGLKAEIHAIYKTWLFDIPDPDDDEDGPSEPANDDGPNFGWWGTFQAVAEVGLFGNLDAVYQCFLHDVCIYLVRKRVEAEEQRRQMNALRKTSFDD